MLRAGVRACAFLTRFCVSTERNASHFRPPHVVDCRVAQIDRTIARRPPSVSIRRGRTGTILDSEPCRGRADKRNRAAGDRPITWLAGGNAGNSGCKPLRRPISRVAARPGDRRVVSEKTDSGTHENGPDSRRAQRYLVRSEEHTSELQSLAY